MTQEAPGPLLVLIPLAGLTVNALSHVLFCRLWNGRKPMICLALGGMIGLAATLGLSGIVLRCPERSLDAWAHLLMNLLTYLALAYGYFHFVNLNLASLRIRLLREIGDARDGLPASAVFARYSAENVIEARLRRLTEAGHLTEREGRYYLGGNKFFLLLFEIFEVMKYAILGRGNRLLADAGVERGAHPVTSLILFFWHDKFCRFVVVGGLNTAFSYALYAVLVLLGLGYRRTLVVLTIVTIVFNFFTYGRLVFGDRRKRLIVKFVCVYGLVFVFNERSLTWLIRHGVGALAAQALLLPLIVVLSFALNRAWVFRTENPG